MVSLVLQPFDGIEVRCEPEQGGRFMQSDPTSLPCADTGGEIA